MRMRKVIAVFGSGSVRESSGAWKIAYETGRLIAASGFCLLNGGYGGVMLASAKGAKEGGGETIGVTTAKFGSQKANRWIDREIRTAAWHSRLYKLVAASDGCVALDGGTGTLVELFVYWEMVNKGLHEKPVVILGSRLRAFVESLRALPEIVFPKELHLASSPEEAVERLKKCLLP